MLSSDFNYQGVLIGSAGSSWLRQCSVTQPISIDTWYAIGVSYNGEGANTAGNYTIAINGVIDERKNAGGFAAILNNSTIGRPPTLSGSNVFYGEMSMFALFGHATSPSRLLELTASLNTPWRIFR
jgi:hypothetical protein